MNISKEWEARGESLAAESEIACINAFTKRELKSDEVYTFAVKLCDNEVDRDGERFTTQTLHELAELFVGKSGIFDHEWSAKGQTARIYRTEVVEEQRPTAAGDPYRYLKGWAYMLRNEKNAALIEEIEGGIKKEVSVGCSVERCVCSVCGRDYGSCEHQKGAYYDGKLCFAELCGAKDAYEWSFVAVPAQPEAGVLKRFGRETDGTLRELVKKRGSAAQSRELEAMEKLAELGQRYVSQLRCEVVRLMLTAEESMDGAIVQRLTEKLGEEELTELKRVYGARCAKKLGTPVQLPGLRAAEDAGDDESDFRV